MKVGHALDIAVALTNVEEKAAYTDFAEATTELVGTDREIAVAALTAAVDALVAAREAWCTIANVLGDGRGTLKGSLVGNRFGHWAHGDCPEVFKAAMADLSERPVSF